MSRTHCVALERLFDRINLDPMIQIKYIDTNEQLAHILTEEASHVMSGPILFVCQTSAISAQFASFRLSALQTAHKQCRREYKKEQVKTMMNVVSKTIEISPTMPSSSASGSPETLIGKPVARDTNEDTASSSQVWQSNANLDRSIGKPRATRKTQKVKGKNWPHNFWISDIECPRKSSPMCDRKLVVNRETTFSTPTRNR